MKTFEEKPIVPSEIIDMHAHIYPDGCLYKIHKHVLINLNF
jgi:predicted amidohydrolase